MTEKPDKGKKNFIHILSSADHEYDDQGMVISAQIRDAGAFLLTQWLEVSCGPTKIRLACEQCALCVLDSPLFSDYLSSLLLNVMPNREECLLP